MKNRREFITLLGAMTFQSAARAQQPGKQIVGYLGIGSSDPTSSMWAAFVQGMREVGIEGQNVSFEFQFAEHHYDRLPALAKSLVSRHVSVIVAPDLVSARVAKAATSAIPIVFGSGIDPVKAGLVASLSHPGTNLTGVSMFTGGLAAKRLQLLRELVPRAALVAVLINPKNANAEAQLDDLSGAVRTSGLRLLALNASTDTDFDTAFATLVQRRADALILGADPMFFDRRDRIVALAASKAIPAIYEWHDMASAGGLMSYGTDLNASFRQLGIYTGQILKGTKPADLPVMQPTKFELVINLKTAKTLGLTVPPSLLAQADEVIE